MQLLESEFDNLIESLHLTLEAGYIPINTSSVNLSKKAEKIASKNPNINTVVTKVMKKSPTILAQKMRAANIYGAWSFRFNAIQGIGDQLPSGQFVVNWLGSHEDYNNIIAQR